MKPIISAQRWLLTTAILAAGSCLSAPAAGALPALYFEQIPTFAESSNSSLGIALAINAHGEVVGLADDANGVSRGFYFYRGELSEIPGLFPGATSHPRAINVFGEIAGSAQRLQNYNGHVAGVATPVIGPRNALRSLLSSDGSDSSAAGMAYAVNAAGETLMDSNEVFVVRADGSRKTWGFDDTPPGFKMAVAINDLGQFVGSARRFSSSNALHAYYEDLRSGEVRDLHDPTRASSSTAADINNRGVVVGEWKRNNDSRQVPIRWVNGIAEVLPFLHQNSTGWIGASVAINDRGDILGYSENQADRRREYWILPQGSTQPNPLSSAIHPTFYQDFDRFVALDLNDSMEVIGTAVKVDSTSPFGSRNKPGILSPGLPQGFMQPNVGLWANPEKPGSGIELNRVDNVLYLTWYTYDQDGLPLWYQSGPVQNVRAAWRAPLYRVSRAGGSETRTEVGSVALTTIDNARFVFHWKLGERGGSENYVDLAGHCSLSSNSSTGTWFDPLDPGYGLSLVRLGEQIGAVAYLYDTAGQPRWAYVDLPIGATETELLVFSNGPCPECEWREPSSVATGRAALIQDATGLRSEISLNHDFGKAQLKWNSNNVFQRLSSEAMCR